MKKIEAVIRSEKVGAVREALAKIGYSGLMMSHIEGHGKQKGKIQEWRGHKMKVELLPKTKIDLVVRNQDLELITSTIVEAARTGEIGDGKIFISDLEDAIRIRTGEKGDTALI
jgi:nitrogen regulatory protein P-II 1